MGYEADEDLLALLGAGINVITGWGTYRDLNHRGAAASFTEHAERGGASFFVTGLNPDFALERYLQSPTGLCSRIAHILVREHFVLNGAEKTTLEFPGMGQPVDQPLNAGARRLVEEYFAPSLRISASVLGHPLEQLQTTATSSTADHDIKLPEHIVKAGTRAGAAIRLDGRSGGKPFLRLRSQLLPQSRGLRRRRHGRPGDRDQGRAVLAFHGHN
ncbi:hypothetical protein ACFRKB_06420 [Streptomyces scopuliridis]|uniref:hypothetical protein n=1 Tax=Streptomyces scopuliridis TaxID=452529 RepID=UPI0036C72631